MTEEEKKLNLFTSPILNYPDLLKNFLFQVVFNFKANSPLAVMFGHDGTVSDYLMLRARSIGLPQKKTEKINTQYMGGKRNYPGRTWVDGDVTIKFDEFQDQALSKIFYEWQNIIYNHSFPNMNKANESVAAGGAIGDFIDLYTATIDIYMYDSALYNSLRYRWRLYDCFPTDNGQVELNAEGTDKVAPSITFNYNTWEMYDQGTTHGPMRPAGTA